MLICFSINNTNDKPESVRVLDVTPSAALPDGVIVASLIDDMPYKMLLEWLHGKAFEVTHVLLFCISGDVNCINAPFTLRCDSRQNGQYMTKNIQSFINSSLANVKGPKGKKGLRFTSDFGMQYGLLHTSSLIFNIPAKTILNVTLDIDSIQECMTGPEIKLIKKTIKKQIT